MASPPSTQITKIYAFIGLDDFGNEGILASTLGGRVFPLVTGDYEVMDLKMKPVAELIAKQQCMVVQLCEFSTKEVLQTFRPEAN